MQVSRKPRDLGSDLKGCNVGSGGVDTEMVFSPGALLSLWPFGLCFLIVTWNCGEDEGVLWLET